MSNNFHINYSIEVYYTTQKWFNTFVELTGYYHGRTTKEIFLTCKLEKLVKLSLAIKRLKY